MTLADSSSFSPAVHPRAIRSGQQRYLADTHGYLDRVVGQSALPDLGLQTRPKLHGMQGSIYVGGGKGVAVSCRPQRP
jgi:hypothetical protein